MITFKHTQDENNENVTLFEAYENERLLGKCLLRCENNIADVFAISSLPGLDNIIQGLLKSAYHYASFKGIYIGKCTAKGIDDILLKMGFQHSNGEYSSDIPSILMGTCCK